jgi:hypothetical protein
MKLLLDLLEFKPRVRNAEFNSAVRISVGSFYEAVKDFSIFASRIRVRVLTQV